MLTHRCLLSKAPVYVSNCCIPVSQVATRQQIRFAARHQLIVPRHRLSTYSRRAFAVAGPMMFNALPDDLRDPAVSTSTFGQSLKTHLFSTYQHVVRYINVRCLLTYYVEAVAKHSAGGTTRCLCTGDAHAESHQSAKLLKG